MRTEQESQTPTLADTIHTIIDYVLVDCHFCLPGKIVSYDAATQIADVQPMIKKKMESGQVLELPVIPSVPVVHPRANGKKTYIHVPLIVGDDVLLVFSERSIDAWKAMGGLTDPQDRRKFNLSDAIAIPGCSAVPDAFTVVDPTAVEITNDKSMLQVLPSGKFKIKGVNDELIDLVSKIADECSKILTNTMLGPQAPLNVAAFSTLKGKLDALKG